MVLLFGVFFVMLFLGVPVLFSMGSAGIIYLLVNNLSPAIMIQRMTSQLMSFSFLAIPFFITLAEVMNSGKGMDRLIRFVKAQCGHWTGGLAQANALISVVFAFVSGTALADCSSLGSTLIPQMEKEGYSKEFSAAVTAATSAVGPIIPPSISMVICGVLLNLSISKLFFAGLIPGLMIGAGFVIVNYFISKKRNYPKSSAFDKHELWESFKGCIWELSLIVVVLGGILGGFFTPTEAGAMGAFAAIIIGVFVRKEIGLKEILIAVKKAAVSSANVLIIIGFAATFGNIMARLNMDNTIANFMLGITNNKYLILLMINILLVILGMVMETNSAMIILMPTFVAVGGMVGIEPIQMVTICVINFVMAGITPPVGMMLYVVCSITNTNIFKVSKEAFPYFIAAMVVLTLVCLFPAISLWLPNLLFA